MGLGVGGAAAAFAVVHAVLIHPLPYPDPDDLVEISTLRGSDRWGFSMADSLTLAERQTRFAGVAGFDPNGMTLSTAEGAERIQAHAVTPGFLPLLGVGPAWAAASRKESPSRRLPT